MRLELRCTNLGALIGKLAIGITLIVSTTTTTITITIIRVVRITRRRKTK